MENDFSSKKIVFFLIKQKEAFLRLILKTLWLIINFKINKITLYLLYPMLRRIYTCIISAALVSHSIFSIISFFFSQLHVNFIRENKK